MEKIGYTYETTNMINGMKYIGSRVVNNFSSYLGSGKRLLEAMHEFGKSNFRCEVLAWYNTIEELRDAEKELLLAIKGDPMYYNVTVGSTGGTNVKEPSTEFKEISLSKVYTGPTPEGKNVYHIISPSLKIEVYFHEDYDIIPERFVKGRGMRPFTNGQETAWFWPGEEPEGWTIGMFCSDITKEKLSESSIRANTSQYFKYDEAHSERTRKNITGVNQLRAICEVCGRETSMQDYRKSHGPDCKHAEAVAGIDLDLFFKVFEETQIGVENICGYFKKPEALPEMRARLYERYDGKVLSKEQRSKTHYGLSPRKDFVQIIDMLKQGAASNTAGNLPTLSQEQFDFVIYAYKNTRIGLKEICEFVKPGSFKYTDALVTKYFNGNKPSVQERGEMHFGLNRRVFQSDILSLACSKFTNSKLG